MYSVIDGYVEVSLCGSVYGTTPRLTPWLLYYYLEHELYWSLLGNLDKA